MRSKRDLKMLMPERLAIILALALMTAIPSWAQSLGGGCLACETNSAEAYCLSHGGSPSSGNCYFPDGSYCGLWSFYNGTCPGKADIEQALWNAEIYCFLSGDSCYNTAPANTPPAVPTTGYGQSGPINPVNPANSAGYWKSEGDRYYLAGVYANSADCYSRAVKLDPALREAWLNLGQSLYFLSRYQESLTAYDTAIKLDPKDAIAWHGRAEALLAQNRIDEAQVALSRAQAIEAGKLQE